MKDKNEEYITVEKYNMESKDLTSDIAQSSEDLDQILDEIDEWSKELEKEKEKKGLLDEKITKTKRVIFKLKVYKMFKMMEIRNLKKKITNLNSDLNSSYDEELVLCVNISKYGLSDCDNRDEQILTPELYKKIVYKLTDDISKIKTSIEDAEEKIKKNESNLENLQIKKKLIKGEIKNVSSHLNELGGMKNYKLLDLKDQTKELNKLNKSIIKTKKR